MSLQRRNRSKAPITLPFFLMLLGVSAMICSQFNTVAKAQDSAEMSAVYGRGVHAYFANRLADAEQLFSEVVQAGSTDPRVYYFRAMTRLRTGHQHEAEADMKIGAAYEARDPGSRHSIGTALQRVQGQGRRILERFRQEGRLKRVQQRRQQSRLRYEQLEQRGPQVLRHKTPAQQGQPFEPSMQLAVPTDPPIPPSDSDDLPEASLPTEADVVPPPPVPNVIAPAAAPAAEEDDLFADPTPEPLESSNAPPVPSPEPQASDSTDDLFGEPASTEPSPPIPPTPEPAADDDLFGDAVSSAESVEEEDAGEMSAESKSGEELDDLFGESDSSPPPVPSTDTDEEDPFGETATETEDVDQPKASESDETEPTEEPAESTEADDLFGGASPQEPAELPSLAENDKVESSKLFGILGRVVGSTVPWKGIQLPNANLARDTLGPADADSLEGIALGPAPTDREVTPASTEEPVDMVTEKDVAEEDLFGETKPETPAAEDPFDDFGGDPSSTDELEKEVSSTDANEETAASSSEEATPQKEEDDLFGDF